MNILGAGDLLLGTTALLIVLALLTIARRQPRPPAFQATPIITASLETMIRAQQETPKARYWRGK